MIMRLLLTGLLAAMAIGTAAAAEPQQPTPSGGTPDKVPFDHPYGTPIALDAAQKLVAAAKAEAEKRGWKLNIAVVDTHGDLVAFARMDGAMLASIAIAQKKARTAARFRRETRVFFEAMEKSHANVATLDPDIVASPGGFPLIVDGNLVGAIGCSGGTGDQDAAVCKAAVESRSR